MSKFPVLSAVTALFLVLGEVPAPATTYYISQSSGNDELSGTAAKIEGKAGPWKTLAKASIEYKSGDRILLKCGDTWDEELRPKGNGTPDNPIFIASYGDGKRPLIDRQDFKQDLIGIHLVDQEGFKIVGIEFNRCQTGIYAEYAVGSLPSHAAWPDR